MDWHDADSSLQEQAQNPSGAGDIEMCYNLNNAPEYNELNAIFGDLPFFLPYQGLDTSSQYCTGFNTLSTSSALGNAASDLQITNQESQTSNYRPPNYNQDRSSDVK